MSSRSGGGFRAETLSLETVREVVYSRRQLRPFDFRLWGSHPRPRGEIAGKSAFSGDRPRSPCFINPPLCRAAFEVAKFTIGGLPAYANLRGYWEFWAENRLEGYAVFATVVIPLFLFT